MNIVASIKLLSIAAIVSVLLSPGAIASAADATLKTPTIQRRVDSLVGLAAPMRAQAIRVAQSRPDAPKLKGSVGTSQSGPSDLELNLICADDWFITWDEDAEGNPVVGSFNLHCADTVIPLG